MLDTSKQSVGKFSEAFPNVEMKGKEQHETLDNLIKQTLVSDTFLSFNKAENSPVQRFHWLDTIDQQNMNQSLDVRGARQEDPIQYDYKTGESPIIKNSLHSNISGGNNIFGRGPQASGEKFHSLKFPEAMVAIAQAAKDLPGWPLMSNKMTMHKCEKCSQEFCSPLNQRRHMRATHRKPLNGDKEDLKKKREEIAYYWDKLTAEKACGVVSSDNLSLMDLSATSLIQNLSTQLQKPGLLSLPQSYIRTATALLDIVQSKPSRFPLSSDELFTILDDASEKNTFYGVTSSSMQRHVFESEHGKVGFEAKNLVASLGFLVELKLVKAWTDDKDVEALRCQKALVEEEEAAQKKREKLQERKRQKKMRQKESKDKERKGGESSSTLQEKFDASSASPRQSSPSSSSSGTDANLIESLEEQHTIEDVNFDNSIDTRGEDGLYRCDPNELPELDSQNGIYEHRTDNRKTSMQGGGWAWKDRKVEGTYPNNLKQAYGNEKRYLDHQNGGQKLLRKAYNHFGNSSHEASNSNTMPRYNHYREQFSGVKKSMTTSGTGHAVWTRKVSQSSGQSNVTSGSELRGSVNESSETDLALHLEHLGINGNLCTMDSEKIAVLSQDSSISLESTSNSEGSISARVGVEEQENSDELVYGSLKVNTGEEGNGALVIGSVMIPFNNTCSNDPLSAELDGESKMNDPSRIDSGQEVDYMDNSNNEVSNLSGAVLMIGNSADASGRISLNETSVLRDPLLIPGGDDTTKMIHWQNTNKLGSLKVWRPVTPGEHSDVSNASELLDRANGKDPEMHEPKTEISSSRRDTLDNSDIQHSGDEVHEKGMVIVSKNSLSDMNHTTSQPATGSFSLISHYSDIANLLCQRWVKATSSSDVIFYHDSDDIDYLSSPLSGRGMSVHVRR